MRWVVVGARGLLGTDMVAGLRARGHDVTAVDRGGVDVRVPGDADAVVAGHDVVVNCAAWTAVDDAEGQEADAFAVNATGAANLARSAAAATARFVQLSTDYVFGGDARDPYAEDAPPTPRSAYGRTKLAGEWAARAEAADHLVVRTAWLYGAHGRCFPRTIARVAAERGGVDVVDDQWGQPTWTRDVVRLVGDLVERAAPAGTYHATAQGRTSWHGFAREVVRAAGLDPSVVTAVPTRPGERPAQRPAWSVLGHDALRAADVDPVGPWEDRWREAAAEVLR